MFLPAPYKICICIRVCDYRVDSGVRLHCTNAARVRSVRARPPNPPPLPSPRPANAIITIIMNLLYRAVDYNARSLSGTVFISFIVSSRKKSRTSGSKISYGPVLVALVPGVKRFSRFPRDPAEPLTGHADFGRCGHDDKSYCKTTKTSPIRTLSAERPFYVRFTAYTYESSQ